MLIGSTMPDRINPAETAILFIDFQYCWIKGRTCEPIHRVPGFADKMMRIGVKAYWIGDCIGPRFEAPVEIGAGDLADDLSKVPRSRQFAVNFTSQTGTIIGKNESDAFTNPLLLEHLRWSGIKHLFGCGYVAGQCVAVTLETGRKLGFGIGLITDLSADNNRDGSFCRLSKWWIEKYEIPLVLEEGVINAVACHRPNGLRLASIKLNELAA